MNPDRMPPAWGAAAIVVVTPTAARALLPGLPKSGGVAIRDGDPRDLAAPAAVFITGGNIPPVSRQTEPHDRHRDPDNRNPPFFHR
ncbi:MAG TPA: hypothetical protein VMH86_01135 [Rhizomicrobium sp.]|nr:hypothetical protein [Rhizomicrobium sp.]